jgi:hypothetical protein
VPSSQESQSVASAPDHEVSMLARRRIWSAYYEHERFHERASLLPVVLIVGMLLSIALACSLRPSRQSVVRNRSLSMALNSQARTFDRLTLFHRTVDKDTIWGISNYYYYYSSSDDGIKRLRRSNPQLPSDPRKLRVDTEIRLPLN